MLFKNRKAIHDGFESVVKAYFESSGWQTATATHSNVMPERISMRMTTIATPTSWYVRNRADQIAVHHRLPLVIQWDAKTHTSKSYNDMTIDALALMYHVWNARLGVQTLLCWNNPNNKQQVGFWCHALPELREVHIPTDRWSATEQDELLGMFANIYPGTRIKFPRGGGGSRTPYVIIDKSTLDTLAHWQECIEEVVQ